MLLTLLNNVNKLLNNSTTNGYKKPWSISAVPPNLRWLVSLLTSHGLQKHNLNSNHTFMTLSFNLPPAYTSHNLSTEIHRPHWNLKKLKKLDCSGRYESAFKNDTTSLVAQSDDDTDETTLMDMDAASTYIEQYSSALCQAIYDSLDE